MDNLTDEGCDNTEPDNFFTCDVTSAVIGSPVFSRRKQSTSVGARKASRIIISSSTLVLTLWFPTNIVVALGLRWRVGNCWQSTSFFFTFASVSSTANGFARSACHRVAFFTRLGWRQDTVPREKFSILQLQRDHVGMICRLKLSPAVRSHPNRQISPH